MGTNACRGRHRTSGQSIVAIRRLENSISQFLLLLAGAGKLGGDPDPAHDQKATTLRAFHTFSLLVNWRHGQIKVSFSNWNVQGHRDFC